MARKRKHTPGRTTLAVLPAERIERRILLFRGQKVMLDQDLAELYGVTTGNLNKAVGRNAGRFPDDFMFQLTPGELANLRFQSGRASWGGRRTPPYAFTEQGVAMLSSVLHSERAIQVNVAIMRAFVRLRELLSSHADLRRKLEALEQKYDAQFRVVFDAIRELMEPPPALTPLTSPPPQPRANQNAKRKRARRARRTFREPIARGEREWEMDGTRPIPELARRECIVIDE